MSKYLPKIIGFLINFISIFSSTYAAKIAVYIFSKPRKGKITDEEISYLKSAIQKDVIHTNFNLKTYHWKGKKETILLAHGWESNSFRWKDLIEILRKQDYYVISLDAPSHGNSGSKTFNALLYSECINSVLKQFKIDVIIGHSVGGTSSAIALHNNNTLLVKKLVSLGAPSNFIGMVKNYSKMMGFNNTVIKAINTYYLKHFGYLPNYFTVANFSENIKAKGLIIHDKKDRIIPFRDALEIKKYYKNSELIKTTGFGHGLKSDKVYNHIIEFLNT